MLNWNWVFLIENKIIPLCASSDLKRLTISGIETLFLPFPSWEAALRHTRFSTLSGGKVRRTSSRM